MTKSHTHWFTHTHAHTHTHTHTHNSGASFLLTQSWILIFKVYCSLFAEERTQFQMHSLTHSPQPRLDPVLQKDHSLSGCCATRGVVLQTYNFSLSDAFVPLVRWGSAGSAPFVVKVNRKHQNPQRPRPRKQSLSYLILHKIFLQNFEITQDRRPSRVENCGFPDMQIPSRKQ